MNLIPDSEPINGLVTVIVPVYNQENYICECLESVLRQSYSALEVIVVDDGSTDSSAQLLHEFGDKIKLLSQRNIGQAAARNNAFRHARGEFIAFMDSDDLWDPEKIARQVAIMKVFPDAIAVYCDHRTIDSDGQVIGLTGALNHPRFSGNILRELITGTCIITPSLVLARREGCKLTRGFDETMKNSDDWDYWIQLSLSGSIIYLAETLASYRRHKSGVSQRANIGLIRALAQLHTFKKYHKQILGKLGSQDQYRYEHAHAAALETAAWCYRLSGERLAAIKHYLLIIKSRPCSIRFWGKLFFTLLLPERYLRNSG